MRNEMRSLKGKEEEIAKRMGTSLLVDQLFTSTAVPYSAEVMVVPLPPKFQVPPVEMYDWTKDPLKLVETL